MVQVSLKRLENFLAFTEISGDEVLLLEPNIPLSNRLLSWWKVLLVKLAGLDAKFCDTEDSILRIAFVMSFSSLSTKDSFFFGVD